MHDKRKFRVLMIHSTPAPPRPEPEKNMEYVISDYCEGDLLSRHWGKKSDFTGRSVSETYSMLGSFEYHPTFDAHLSGVRRFLNNLFFYVRTGLRLSRTKGKYDLIITYGPYTCLLAALLIRLFTGSKIVVMLPAPPIETFKEVPGPIGRFKYLVAWWVVPTMVRAADAIWAYYPEELDALPGTGYPPVFISPEFVPVLTIAELSQPATNPCPRYIYFLGSPFDRKGVDLLIKAFNRIAEKHPDVCLKIVGHCPNLAPYQELANHSVRVQFRPGVFHNEAMELMDNCAVFVLPSRLEGVPRVLMEAMACKRPIVASRICGTPTLIEHGKHGLLFESEDVDGLAECLDRVLSDPALARELASQGYRRIVDEFSERAFVRFIRNLAVQVTRRAGPDDVVTPNHSAPRKSCPPPISSAAPDEQNLPLELAVTKGS